MFGGAADIDALLADFKAAGQGVDVTIDGKTVVTGLRDHEAVEFFGGSAEMPSLVAGEVAVHIRTGSLPGLVNGGPITVDGVGKKVLKALPYGDGLMSRVVLTAA